MLCKVEHFLIFIPPPPPTQLKHTNDKCNLTSLFYSFVCLPLFCVSHTYYTCQFQNLEFCTSTSVEILTMKCGMLYSVSMVALLIDILQFYILHGVHSMRRAKMKATYCTILIEESGILIDQRNQ